MQVAIIGADGQLGTELSKAFPQAIKLTQKDLDIENKEAVEKFFRENSVDVIVNTAAYHDMNKTETNPIKTFSVNSIAVNNLVEECNKNNVALVQISTDYVFDGKKQQPYHEEDITSPLNWYGISKVAGETMIKNKLGHHYIIRLSSLFGHAGCKEKGGGNFVEMVLKKLATGNEINMVNDQFMSPTYAYDAAIKIKEILDKKLPYGTYHVTNSGQCSWYELAAEIANKTNSKTKITPVSTTGNIINRPKYSALENKKLKEYKMEMRHWKEALEHYLSNRPQQQ